MKHYIAKLLKWLVTKFFYEDFIYIHSLHEFEVMVKIQKKQMEEVDILKKAFNTMFTPPKYLDEKKYRGRGRPRKQDYTEAKPLFNN